ncbi:MAG: RDD family protein [Bacilli bacterium]
MKALFSRRVIAYLIDFFIISALVSLVTMFVPVDNSTESLYKDLEQLNTDLSENKIESKEYYEKVIEINYYISKDNVIVDLISIVIYILYFVVYQVYNNGQTLGKKLLKIKLKKSKDSVLTMDTLLIRSLILYGIGFNIINLILILFLKKDTFIGVNTILGYTQYAIIIIIIFMVIFRKDGRGLHDVISGTVVVNEEEIK